MHLLTVIAALAGLAGLAAAHSQLTEPQSTSPMTCRMGGEPQFGVEHCAGPCDKRAIDGGFANHASPDNPAAVYRRGQRVRMKYSRNNHAPGGFIRLTLVPPNKMMDKAVHARNAFYYSCWGANPTAAGPAEQGEDGKGFSMIGSDGAQHSHPKGYYVNDVTIPDVVPDGKYVLGWVWFGGTGGSVDSNSPQEPGSGGYFSDYWSCSFVEIRGGDPLKKQYTPVFNNDMKQFSNEGCMAANDNPGICSWEPCTVPGRYQKPKQFKNGSPQPLTPENFGGSSAGAQDGGAPDTSAQDSNDQGSNDQEPEGQESNDQEPEGQDSNDQEPEGQDSNDQAPSPTPVTAEDQPSAPSPTPVSAEDQPSDPSPTPVTVEDQQAAQEMGEKDMEEEMELVMRRSCRCLAAGEQCWGKLAELTKGYCVKRTKREDQPEICKKSCCDYCKLGRRRTMTLCARGEIQAFCG